MSSIPSTIVRPLHESGTPAGPSLIGIIHVPAGTTQVSSYDNPFPLAVRKKWLFYADFVKQLHTTIHELLPPRAVHGRAT
jgi:hypothetical protein